MKKKNPKISVVMSCYNRAEYSKLAIESILGQTYKDFEFIIIDDFSEDNTAEVIQDYADKDERIVFIRNKQNMDYNYNLRKGFEIAKGEYIARMDDDDISMPERFEKQVEYLDKHPEITVLGTFIEPIGEGKAESWVTIEDSDELEIAMNFYNPMCHPSVMIRNSFLKENNLNYSEDALYAEEYHLWMKIILAGGKLANLPEELVQYRMHKKSVTQESRTQKIQNKTAEGVRENLLKRFSLNKSEVKRIRKSIFKYPFGKNNKKHVENVLKIMKKHPNIAPIKGIEKFEKRYLGKKSDMHIFFASDNNFAQHLAIAIGSILLNATSLDDLNFYILDGGISDKNKKKIEKMKNIKDFNIEFIKVDDSLFNNCPITNECQHISKQTYYRYIIPKLKPELDKAFYFDCDIVVENSLNDFWNIDLDDKYAAVVEELFMGAYADSKRLGTSNYFNAGVMLINLKKWKEENITEKLFNNTVLLSRQNKILWVDQCVLNYTFNDNVVWLSPKYNLQCNAFYEGKYSAENNKELKTSIYHPVIIHFNSFTKPWSKKTCRHPLWKRYWFYAKRTPFKNKYAEFKIKRKLKNIFALLYRKKKSECENKFYILGIQIAKIVKRDFETKIYFLGINIFSKYNYKKVIDQILYNQKWQNYALSRLNRGQNVIFEYNSGMPMCSDNFSYERVIAFDIDDAPADHKERYLFAANFINKDDKVLDLACGTGYGAALFAKIAKSATGVDIDKYAINFANKIFIEREKNENLHYECKNVFKDPVGKFDKIISFETIEHLENDELFVSKLFDALEDNGKLICSVPNEKVFPFVRKENPFHIKHYTVDDLTKLLTSAGFIIEDIYFQYHEFEEKVLKQTDNEGYTIICIAKKS